MGVSLLLLILIFRLRLNTIARKGQYDKASGGIAKGKPGHCQRKPGHAGLELMGLRRHCLWAPFGKRRVLR